MKKNLKEEMELQFKLNSLKIPPVRQYLHSTKN